MKSDFIAFVENIALEANNKKFTALGEIRENIVLQQMRRRFRCFSRGYVFEATKWENEFVAFERICLFLKQLNNKKSIVIYGVCVVVL